MKRLIAIAVLFFFCAPLFINATVDEGTEYNVYQYEMKLDRGEVSTAYYNNEKCYKSKIKYTRTKDYIMLASDDFDIAFHIASHSNSAHSTKYITARVGGNAHPFAISEMLTEDGKFYLVITPIRFNVKYSIDEAGLIISTENVCRIAPTESIAKIN